MAVLFSPGIPHLFGHLHWLQVLLWHRLPRRCPVGTRLQHQLENLRGGRNHHAAAAIQWWALGPEEQQSLTKHERNKKKSKGLIIISTGPFLAHFLQMSKHKTL